MLFNTHVADTLIVLGMPPFMPADGFSDVVVVVTGYDLNGNPVNGGTVLVSTGETDAYGEVTNLRWQAPDSVEAAITITVQDLDPRGNIVLSKSISVSE